MALLRVDHLNTYIQTQRGAVRAVDGVSFSLQRGQTFAVLGESGCGKSMTALSIMRLLPEHVVCGGTVYLGEEDLLGLSEVQMRQVRGNRIAMIFQEPMTSLNPVLTVGQQIGESLQRHKGLRGGPRLQRTIELLNDVGIPDPAQRVGEYPHQLSGGMKQRIMIAIALAGDPEILIADEPTTALDVTIQAQILALLLKLQQENGLGIFLITHDMGVVAEMADRVAVMYAGEIVEEADRDTFFSNARHPYSQKLFHSLPTQKKRNQTLDVIPGQVPSLAQAFTACRFANRCGAAWQLCHEQVPRWVDLEGGQGARCHLLDETVAAGHTSTVTHPTSEQDHAEHDTGNILLQVNGLKVHFPIHRGIFKRVKGYVYAVDDVSFQLKTSHTLALVGESGCGKTTVGKSILQLIAPTAGTVMFSGTDLGKLRGKALRLARRDFQIIFQDPFSSMNPRMMVGDIIEEGMKAQYIGDSKKKRRETMAHLLDQVGLNADAMVRYPHEFSGGQRQRICIARALAVRPKMIVCDEPTSALDVSVQAQILNLLSDLQRRFQLSFIFITHNISVVSYLAHDVAVMYLGRIVEQGSVEEVLNHPKHPYTKALLEAVPTVDSAAKQVNISVEGDIPSPINPPRGCHFHPRCPYVTAQCRESYPDSHSHSETHRSRCHLHG